MTTDHFQQRAMHAARQIQHCWTTGSRIDHLDIGCRPDSLRDAYEVQAALASLRNEPVAGWKLAATAAAGQRHINVTHPLAGRLFASRVLTDGATIPLADNRMRMAEAEFVLMIGRDLPPRPELYADAELADAVSAIHPGLEIPDSRFSDFAKAGAASLVADTACASWFVLGASTGETISLSSLAERPSALLINGECVTTGFARDALGGPLNALSWLVTTLGELGLTLCKGQFVTTGVTGLPSPIAPGDRVTVDLGRLGTVSATMDRESR